MTAAALVIQYWIPREKLNPGVFIAIFLVIIFCINYFGGIKFFGELEFWLSSFKVIIIIGIILFSLIIACGGGPNGDAPGFRYWNNPGAFNAPFGITGATGKFVGFWSVMVNATFAYLGTELVGVTAGEAQNPRRSIPKAIKLTFYRILVFYCLSVLLVGMIVPYDAKELTFANKSASSHGATAAASPFVVAATLAGVKALPSLINACILVFVFSASNSDLYIASRTLYGLASDESAPAIFRRTDSRGVPYPALMLATLFACLAFMNVSNDSKKVFGYFVNLTTIFGLMTWISILVTHLFFLKARKAQGLDDSAMPYVSPVGKIGTMVALFFCILICLTKNFSAFITQDGVKFQKIDFITGYIGIPVYLVFLFGHMIITKSRGVKPHEADFYTGKSLIDNEEQEYLEKLKLDRIQSTGARKFYHRYVSWLF